MVYWICLLYTRKRRASMTFATCHAFAAKVDARPSAFPTFGSSDHSGRPHIECSRDRFDYVVCERGSEFERRSHRRHSRSALLIFKDVTFALACDFELAHRKPRTDCRRLIFSRNEELIALSMMAGRSVSLPSTRNPEGAPLSRPRSGARNSRGHWARRAIRRRSARLASRAVSAALASRRVDVHHRGHRRR